MVQQTSFRASRERWHVKARPGSAGSEIGRLECVPQGTARFSRALGPPKDRFEVYLAANVSATRRGAPIDHRIDLLGKRHPDSRQAAAKLTNACATATHPATSAHTQPQCIRDRNAYATATHPQPQCIRNRNAYATATHPQPQCVCNRNAYATAMRMQPQRIRNRGRAALQRHVSGPE